MRNIRGSLRSGALKLRGGCGMVKLMNMRTNPRLWLAWTLVLVSVPAVGEPPATATAAFDAYAGVVEARLERQHTAAAADFLSPVESPDADGRMRRGEMVIEKLGGKDVPGAMLHHWRGTAFVPGATGADFERLMRDFADLTAAITFTREGLRAVITIDRK